MSKLVLTLSQLPEGQREAIFSGLPKQERAKLLVRLAFQLPQAQRLQYLETSFKLLDAGDIFPALQIVPRDDLEALVLQRLEQEGNLGETAKFLVDSLSEKELQGLASLAFLPRDLLILMTFLINLLAPDRRNELTEQVRQKKGLD